MTIDTPERDDDQGASPPSAPSGFPLPQGGRPYPSARDWLAETFDKGWKPVSACVVDAVDPCEVAQAVNLWAAAQAGADRESLNAMARRQQVRIKMEFDDAGRVWRVEAQGGGFVTCVQPADAADALEVMSGDVEVVRFSGLAALADDARVGGNLPEVATMAEVMNEHEEVSALIATAIDRSPAYDDLHFVSRIANTWLGLASALGMAQVVLGHDERFIADFSRQCEALAERLRPDLTSTWNEQVAAGRILAERKGKGE